MTHCITWGVRKLVFYAQSTGTVISGRSHLRNHKVIQWEILSSFIHKHVSHACPQNPLNVSSLLRYTSRLGYRCLLGWSVRQLSCPCFCWLTSRAGHICFWACSLLPVPIVTVAMYRCRKVHTVRALARQSAADPEDKIPSWSLVAWSGSGQRLKKWAGRAARVLTASLVVHFVQSVATQCEYRCCYTVLIQVLLYSPNTGVAIQF